MIRKLKFKFILLSMSALVALLALILVGMNGINYRSVVGEADMTLSFLSQHKGTFPEFGDRPNDKLPPHMSLETPYESRYFSVLMDADGVAASIDTRRIRSVDDATAEVYAASAAKRGRTSGFIGDFRYQIKSEPNGTRITFLDCGRTLNAFYGFLWTSLFMATVGLVIVFFIVFILSGRIIRPIAESYAKQKQFITDAGHEIKTPLTIIAANVDILEMELGEGNESIGDIRSQTHRLRSLTDDLVMLARMEESVHRLPKIEFPISEVAADAAHPFCAPAVSQEKRLRCNIQPWLTFCGNDKAIVQLISILLDNALKYSVRNSEIILSLTKQGRSMVLAVSNVSEYEITAEQLGHIFDRFYRADASRNSETGGHGIGLSVAQAIVTAHGGKMTATVSESKVFQITAIFPI